MHCRRLVRAPTRRPLPGKRAWAAALGVLSVVVTGCATQGPTADFAAPFAARLSDPRPDVADCARLYADVDDAVAQAGVHDAQARRIEGFPYLRIDRELASVAPDALTRLRFDEWLDGLAALDRLARGFELRNLPAAARDALAGGARPVQRGALSAALARCAETLRRADFALPETRDVLMPRAHVPDDYDTWKRVVGLYELAKIPFADGIRRWQQETLRAFSMPLAELPQRGRRTRYLPADTMPPLAPHEVARTLAFARSGRLGLVRLARADRDRLFATYAPAFDIDHAGEFDRLGAPVWREGGEVSVDASRPVVYTHLALTRYRGVMLPQLVYVAWFAERPRTAPGDLLAGRLDGLVWRVTLDPEGAPLVFDSMHPCGCYHLFVPTARAELRAQPDTLDEWAFVPQRLDELRVGDRTVLRVASGTHYLERVGVAAPASARREATAPVRYTLAPLDELRSLPLPGGGRRSLYGPDGIVAGTERGERYLFWPMGIREPGAMRQWGRHATAFVGRRHFDDMDLIERYFTLH